MYSFFHSLKRRYSQTRAPIDTPRCVCVGGGGGKLIYPYIHRLGPFLEVQDITFQYFWGVWGVRKKIGYAAKIKMVIFRGHFCAF